MEPEVLAQQVVELALERKALDVVTIDVRGKVSYADYIVVASGTSDRHVQSIAESVRGTLHKSGVRVLGREGMREGQWALIDFGDVVFHVFHAFARQSYDLDNLWQDAPSHRAEQPAAPQTAQEG